MTNPTTIIQRRWHGQARNDNGRIVAVTAPDATTARALVAEKLNRIDERFHGASQGFTADDIVFRIAR